MMPDTTADEALGLRRSSFPGGSLLRAYLASTYCAYMDAILAERLSRLSEAEAPADAARLTSPERS